MPAHQHVPDADQDPTHRGSPSRRFLLRQALPVSRRVGPYWALLVILLVGGAIAAALTAVSAEVYEAVAESDGVAVLDHPVLEVAVAMRRDWLDTAVTWFTNVGGPIGMTVFAVSAMVLLAVNGRSWIPVILLPAAVAGSLAMTVAGKDTIGRLRPPLEFAVPPFETSPSFPSGHSLNALVVFGMVAYLLVLRQRRRWVRALTVALAVVLAGAMGLSRVYLGHHWLTDVLVAWTLGIAWLAVVITAHRLFLTFRLLRLGTGKAED